MTKFNQTLEESFAQIAHRMKRVLEIGDLDETQILHLRYVIELLGQVERKTHWLAQQLSAANNAAAQTQTTGNVKPTYNDKLDDETLPF